MLILKGTHCVLQFSQLAMRCVHLWEGAAAQQQATSDK